MNRIGKGFLDKIPLEDENRPLYIEVLNKYGDRSAFALMVTNRLLQKNVDQFWKQLDDEMRKPYRTKIHR